MGMGQRSPWSTIFGSVVLVGFAMWNFATAYAPPDSTPLRSVDGTIANVITTWVHHSTKGGGWNSPVVTIVLADSQTIRFTGHSRGETPAAQPLSALRRGATANARVDATGEIWELSVEDRPVVALADTLARHHALVHTRNLICFFLLAMGLGLGAYGVRRLKVEGY
ncbi:MAG TPA: hypothetical protein VGH80_07255 [Xanthomonadaceae bacterium]